MELHLFSGEFKLSSATIIALKLRPLDSHRVTPAAFRDRLGATTLHYDVTPAQGVFIEAWTTSIVILVLFGSTNSRRKNDLFMPTIPVGFAIALGMMASVSISKNSLLHFMTHK